MSKKENNTWKLDLLEVKFFNAKPRFPRTKLLLKSKKLKFNLPESREAALAQVDALKAELCERKIHGAKTKLERALKKYLKVEGGKASLQEAKIKDKGSKAYAQAALAASTLQSMAPEAVVAAKVVKLCEKVYLTTKELKLSPPTFLPQWVAEAIIDKNHPHNPSFQFKNNEAAVNNAVSKIFNTKELKDLLTSAESNMKLVLGPVARPPKAVVADGQSGSEVEESSGSESDDELSGSELEEEEEADGAAADAAYDSEGSVDYDAYKDMLAASSDEEEDEGLVEGVNYNDVTDQEQSDEMDLDSNEGHLDSESEAQPLAKAKTKTAKEPKEPKGKKPKEKKEKLPELATGYFSGDSGSEISEDEVVKSLTKPRKNRRGQRARQKIWEQKFGTKATHVQKEHERYKSERETKQLEYEARVAKRAALAAPSGANDSPLGDRAAIQAAALKRKAQEEGPLHPSWEAKKKQKEMTQAKFSGKKVTFD